MDNLADKHKTDGDKSVTDAFAGGFVEAFKQPVDGARQMLGSMVEPSQSDGSIAEKVGHFAGGSALFLGGAAVARRLPLIGQIAEGKAATIGLGGTLGMLTPLADGESGNHRAMNAATGGLTMGALEFGPGAIGRITRLGTKLQENTFKNGLLKYSASGAAAGLIQTEADSFIQTGHRADYKDMALGAGTWAAMGGATHSIAHPLANKFAARQSAKQEASQLPTEVPWHFKDVEDINARQLGQNHALEPGHYRVNFESQNHARNFNLYIPEKAGSNGTEAPLITFLNGMVPKGKSEDIARELNYNKFADADGAIVASLHARDGRKGFLTGNVHSWNDKNFGYTKQDSSYSDKVAFEDMMEFIRKHVPQAHTEHVAVGGFSLGGKMANRIAAEKPYVSALASIQGTIDRNDTNIMKSADPHKVDTRIDLGDKSKVFPENGGRGLFTTFLKGAGLSRPRDQARYWSSLSEAPAERTVTNAEAYTRNISINPVTNGVTDEFVIKNGTHAVDGAPPQGTLIQSLMGKPKPADYYDVRTGTWEFLRDSVQRDIDKSHH